MGISLRDDFQSKFDSGFVASIKSDAPSSPSVQIGHAISSGKSLAG